MKNLDLLTYFRKKWIIVFMIHFKSIIIVIIIIIIIIMMNYKFPKHYY